MKTAFIQKNHFLHSRRCTTASFLVPLWIKKDYEIYVFLLKKEKKTSREETQKLSLLILLSPLFPHLLQQVPGVYFQAHTVLAALPPRGKNQRKQAPLIVLKLLHLTYRIHFFILVRSRSCSKPHIFVTKPSHAVPLNLIA